jgi:hypothetical protein
MHAIPYSRPSDGMEVRQLLLCRLTEVCI